MKPLLIKMVLGAAGIGALWTFVGVERIVGDHELGVSWEVFIKHRPTLQLRFDNPAWKGLELVAINEFSTPQRAAFSSYCEIRFGEADLRLCHRRIADQKI